MATAPSLILPDRLYPLRETAGQMRYVHSPHRFNVVPAGRRSGKTERAKRKLVFRALDTARLKHPFAARFFAGAPTRQQAKQIYWQDLKAMTQPFWMKAPSETELTIRLINGSELVVMGLDAPSRIEGQPWDGGVLDEYADMASDAWMKNVRPALSDRQGWCDLIGVPEGRNHYFDVYERAMQRMLSGGRNSEWGAFTWHSSEVLPPEEIEAAKEDLDPLSFAQEYEASFVNFQGRAYHSFTDANKARLRDRYDPARTLIVCLDFNVSPGVAVIAQSMRDPALAGPDWFTAVIGEVHIPEHSTTEMVCRRILGDWAGHRGLIEVYGDASGGAQGTAKVAGSDWEIVRQTLRFGDPNRDIKGWGDRVALHVPPRNPSERSRVNAVNTRLLNGRGDRRMYLDPAAAPQTVRDFEGVRVVVGGSGEIDKKHDRKLTHWTDALGYYVVHRFPLAGRTVSTTLISV